MSSPQENKYHIGVALSGGTLKASAHIGVLNAFERLGIQPDCIAGTSAGSLVSVLYAYGYRERDFQEIINNFPGLGLVDYGFPIVSSFYSWTLRRFLGRYNNFLPKTPTGLLLGRKLISYIDKLLQKKRPTEFPFFIVATDIITGNPIVFHNHYDWKDNTTHIRNFNLPKVIAGSCALPGIFTPVTISPYLLIDGAVRHYVPVQILRDIGCKKIIAVNLNRLPERFYPNTFIDVLLRAFDILLRESIDNDMHSGDDLYIIEPDVQNMKWYSFSEMKICVYKGLHETMKNHKELFRFLNL